MWTVNSIINKHAQNEYEIRLQSFPRITSQMKQYKIADDTLAKERGVPAKKKSSVFDLSDLKSFWNAGDNLPMAWLNLQVCFPSPFELDFFSHDQVYSILGYYGALRSSENHPIQWSGVAFTEDGGAVVTFVPKKDRGGRPTDSFLLPKEAAAVVKELRDAHLADFRTTLESLQDKKIYRRYSVKSKPSRFIDQVSDSLLFAAAFLTFLERWQEHNFSVSPVHC